MATPSFFIVGAAKSGTTSLYQYLVQHPQICMPSLKEPHFFGEYRPPGPLITDMTAYLRLFEGCASCDAVGEASTAYLYSPGAARQIKSAFPNAKIIVLLRNPVDRAYSLYWHHVRDGTEDLDFEGALAAEESRIKAGWRFGYHMIHSGMYYEQVKRYMDEFGARRVKVILFEDLKGDAEAVLRECSDFLGVDQSFRYSATKVHNKSGPPRIEWISEFLRSSSRIKRVVMAPFPRRVKERWKIRMRDLNVGDPPAMNMETRKRLIEYFREDVNQLGDLIDRDLSSWLRV